MATKFKNDCGGLKPLKQLPKSAGGKGKPATPKSSAPKGKK